MGGAAERAFRLLAENADDLLARHSRDGAWRYLSPSARRVTGWRPEELVGMRPEDLAHPDDADRARALFADLDHGPTTALLRLRRADGGHTWLEVRARLAADPETGEVEVHTTARDVDDRVRAERELTRFRALAEQTPDLVAMADGEQRVRYLNPAGRALLGLPRDADLGHLRMVDLVAEPARAAFAEAVAAAAREGVWTGESEFRAGDGHPVPVQHVCLAHRDERDGKGYYSLVARDIRAQRAAEATRRAQAAEQAARRVSADAAARLRGIVDGLALIVWEADARTWEFTFVSERAEELLGYPTERWLGDPGFWTSIIHPDDRDEAVRLCLLGLAESDDYDFAYRVVAADGRVLWVHDVVHVVRDEHGEPRELQGVLLDITARRAAEDRDRFLSGLERALQPVRDPEAIMAIAAERLGARLGVPRCAYAEVEADEDHFTITGDYASGLPHLTGRFAMSDFGAQAHRAMVEGRAWVVDDAEADPRLDGPERDAYRRTGMRAAVSVPVRKDGRFVAGMAVHQDTPRRWAPEEVELVGAAVNRCWESLERARAERALRESEERHRLLVERATDGIWLVDRDLRYVDANPAGCALLGRTREELLGRRVADVVRPEELSRLAELVAGLTEGRVVTEVWDVHRGDGEYVALELSIQATPSGLQAIGRDVTARRLAERERELLLEREHEIAETLQRSLLPRELPALARLTAAARYLPASRHARAGGDWYELLPVGETEVALVVGDVVGKGPAAAAVMGQLRSALAGYLLDGHPPAAALERLDTFARRVDGAIGSSCACLTLDWSTGVLRWALAGHLPPLLLEAGGPRFLTDGAGTVLGVTGRRPYREATTTLAPGSSVLLYTDGLVERREDVIDVGLARLAEAAVGDHDPDTMATTLIESLLDPGEGPADDVALLAVRLIPEPLRLRLPADPAALGGLRRQVRAWSTAAALPAEFVVDLQLALGEATANAVEHAYPPGGGGEFEVSLSRTDDGSIEAGVRDWGRWRPEPEDNGHRGHGLGLIRQLSERSSIEPGPDGTSVLFRLGARRAAVASAPPPEVVEGVDFSADPGQVRIIGDLDIAGVDALRRLLLEQIGGAAGAGIDVDLTGVGYLSSAGVALLAEAATKAAGVGTTMTVGVTEGTAAARVLTLSGLDAALKINSAPE